MRTSISTLLGIPTAVILLSLSACNRPAELGDPPQTMGDVSSGGDALSNDEVLRRIDVGPYEVPNLPLRLDPNYAQSATDVEPFGHVKPFKEHFLEQLEYTGPGRATPEPEGLESIKIGFLGPIEPTVSVATGGKSHEEELGKAMLNGAQLAIEQANAAGGYRGKIPFELVVRNDNGLWGASGNEIITMAYIDRVWAILGTIDGANTHIAIRVALKAEIPMLTSGDTDPTLSETNIPWVIRCIGDDRQQNYLLLDYMYRKMGYKRVAIIRASNRYGRFGVREIKDGSRRLKRPVVVEMAYKVGSGKYDLQVDRVQEANPDAIVHWGDAEDGALILNEIRSRGMKQPYLACDRCVSDTFVELAGDNAEGVICGFPWDPTREDPKFVTFQAQYREKYGTDPDTYAAHGFDGTNMLIWGIAQAGLNRAKIRDVIAHRDKAWPGVTGDIPLSATLDDAGEIFLTRYEKGRWRYYSREELEIPSGRIVPKPREERAGSGIAAADQ